MIPKPALRLTLAALALLLTGPLAVAQLKDPPHLAPEKKKQLVQNLFESEDEKTLAASIQAARKAGLPAQAILEARFLFLVDQQDFAAVAALAPILEKQKRSFRIEDSEIFNVPEEFFAIVEFCHALGALERNDPAKFKRHITEAFWLSPRQAQAFAPHIERLRLQQAMANLKVDLNTPFRQQADPKKVTLASLAGKSNHLLVHFWSPWSTECEANLPDFLAMTNTLLENEVAVISVLIESDADTIAAAKKFRAGIAQKNTGAWIVDNSSSSLNRTLRVLDLPTVALISTEGAVLYNGHPADDHLWDTLRKVAPKIQRPRVQPTP